MGVGTHGSCGAAAPGVVEKPRKPQSDPLPSNGFAPVVMGGGGRRQRSVERFLYISVFEEQKRDC